MNATKKSAVLFHAGAWFSVEGPVGVGDVLRLPAVDQPQKETDTADKLLLGGGYFTVDAIEVCPGSHDMIRATNQDTSNVPAKVVTRITRKEALQFIGRDKLPVAVPEPQKEA